MEEAREVTKVRQSRRVLMMSVVFVSPLRPATRLTRSGGCAAGVTTWSLMGSRTSQR